MRSCKGMGPDMSRQTAVIKGPERILEETRRQWFLGGLVLCSPEVCTTNSTYGKRPELFLVMFEFWINFKVILFTQFEIIWKCTSVAALGVMKFEMFLCPPRDLEQGRQRPSASRISFVADLVIWNSACAAVVHSERGRVWASSWQTTPGRHPADGSGVLRNHLSMLALADQVWIMVSLS